MSNKIWFDPTSDKWVLSDGEHYLEVPHWAREIIVDEFERETRQLRDENAALLELVSGLEYCVQGYVCDSCPLYDPSGTNHRRCESLERELGVEVNG